MFEQKNFQYEEFLDMVMVINTISANDIYIQLYMHNDPLRFNLNAYPMWMPQTQGTLHVANSGSCVQ